MTNPLAPAYEPGRPLRLAGMMKVYSFADSRTIPQHWRTFAPRMAAAPGKVGDTAYGVVTDAGRPDGFAYMTAVEVRPGAAVPDDFESVTVDAARFAVFRHEGNVASLPKTMEAISRDFMPEVKDRVVVGVIERYGETFDPNTGEGGFDVLVPLNS